MFSVTVPNNDARSTFIMSGDVVYSGEFVLKSIFRGNRLAAHMVFLSFVLAQFKCVQTGFTV